MADDAGIRYYAAVLASGASVLGWIGALVGTGYSAYLFLFDPPAWMALLVTGAALLAGIVFAKLEKRLYQVDEDHWLF
ncbi:MAG: hypothetical protein ABEH66_00340 [Halobacteriales archaeon]